MANAKQCDICRDYFIPKMLAYKMGRPDHQPGFELYARVQFLNPHGHTMDLCAGCTVEALINLVSLMRQELEEAKSNVG